MKMINTTTITAMVIPEASAMFAVVVYTAS